MKLVMDLIGKCKVNEYKVSTTIWKNYLNPLTIKTKDFNGYTIIYQKPTMNRLSKGNSIWSSVVNNDLVQIKNHRKPQNLHKLPMVPHLQVFQL